ncbi:MAG: methionine--tRNA ligase [Nitrososphaerota archaeon]
MHKWIICSAWPYLDGRPHIGTFMHLLSADVYSRYLRMLGEEVVSVSGSDEHGTPIEVEALRLGSSPKELSNRYHDTMLKLLDAYMIKLDNYTRTESKVHIQFVRDFYLRLEKNGYIYPKVENQLYCEYDKRFLPDRFVEGICPYCGAPGARGDQCDSCGRLLEPTKLIEPKCVICGKTPVIKETKQWFFDLPSLSNEIQSYIERNKNLPENARNFSINWLKEGLQARAVTRDNRWGIPAPFKGADNKTIYVWMEAVLGYLSAVKELEDTKGSNLFEFFWKDKESRSVFFIGKDNIPFHTIILPALLIASKEGYALPWQVSSTEFVLFEGKKFSKSKHIGIWMDEAMTIAPPEYWRFVMMYLRPEIRDANFTWSEFDRMVNDELNDVLGNFINRVLSFVERFFDSKVPDAGDLNHESKSILLAVSEAWNQYRSNMDAFAIREALKIMVDLARKGNEYMSSTEPWLLVKNKNNRQSASTVLYTCCQVVYTLAIMMYPFMPSSAEKLLRMLGLDYKVIKAEVAGHAALSPGHKIGRVSQLFSKVQIPKA